MRIKSMAGSVLVTALLGLGMAAVPAAATQPEGAPQIDVEEGECGEVTFTADGKLHVSSETVTAGFVVRVDGDGPEVHRGGLEATNGEQDFNVETTVGPFHRTDGGPVTIGYRVFGGPVRGDDNPAWTTTPTQEMIDAHKTSEGEHWQASDSAPFVVWHTLEVDPCKVPVEEVPEPTHTDKTCDEPATITIPEAEGVEWSVGQQNVEPGTSQTAPGSYNVTAFPAQGYVFDLESGKETTQYTVEVFGPKEPCPGPTGPQGPPGEDGEDGKDGEIPSSDKTCDDFDSRDALNTHLIQYPGDLDRLDGDDDGKACDDIIDGDDVKQTSNQDSLPKTGAMSPLAIVGVGLAMILVGGGILLNRRLGARKR